MASDKAEKLRLNALRAILSYEADTGRFRWLTADGGVNIGTVAGNVNSTGYLVVGINGRKFRQHRLAWFYHYGVWPVGTIDHRDGNKLNNKIDNLRDVSQAINMQNQRKPSSRNTSGYLGVYWSKRCNGFMAAIGMGRKKKRRGPYSTAGRAYSSYIELKRRHHDGCTL